MIQYNRQSYYLFLTNASTLYKYVKQKSKKINFDILEALNAH